ncbi:uncharacterized protein PFLUO_LOCUS9022 [Penicillium psychrofluorescens]|uniref:uncharacterized protein n=1 Tax=Penicillium psychrofluorescens TaxID=3158075 RepID=UPI003CCE4823
MEGEADRVSSAMRLQTSFPYPISLSSSFKLDEGYSDETRSQTDKESASDQVMVLPDWLLAQTEAERAEFAYSVLRSLRISTIAGVVERFNPLLHMDPVIKLPPELTLEVFSYLEPRVLLKACLSSRSWRSRILDSGLWRLLYINEGWRVDLGAIRRCEHAFSEPLSPQARKSRPPYLEIDLEEPKQKKRVPPSWLDSRSAELHQLPDGDAEIEADDDNSDVEGDHDMIDATDRDSSSSSRDRPRPAQNFVSPLRSPLDPPLNSSLFTRSANGSAKLNWAHLYKQRRRLEANWQHGRYTNFQLPDPSRPEEAHREYVYAIQFSGKWLVSGSRDRTVRVWDLETKRLHHAPLIGHVKSVLCLQFDASPEEDIIISGSSDQSVIIWKFSTGQKIHQIKNAHADSVLNLKFDHRYLVTCSKDRTLKVWNRRDLLATDDDYPRICHGAGATYPSYIVDLSDIPPNMLEARMANEQIKPVPAYSRLMSMEGHGAAVNAMQLHGDEIVTASGDRMIKVWNIRTGACVKTLMGHEKGIACVQFDGRRIISGSNDNTIRIYDHISGAEVACLRGHSNLVRTVQAGFGDPPGADEALRLEALAVENEFWNARRAGLPVDLGPRAQRRAGRLTNTSGSRDPNDIPALGAKIPPGGGGSEWARIVSGSYDESILIWHKDREGSWSIAHRLCQAEALSNATQAHIEANPAAASAQPLQLLIPVPNAPAPIPVAPQNTNNNNAPNPQQQGTAAAAAHNQNHAAVAQGAHHLVHPLPQALLATGGAMINPVMANHHHHHHAHAHGRRGSPPTSRVFKVQFDSRKIVCASHDPRIVGWDFACDDPEIIEACPFFGSL